MWMKFNLSVYSFIDFFKWMYFLLIVILVPQQRNLCLTQGYKDLAPLFSCRIFIALGSTFSSAIPPELTCVYNFHRVWKNCSHYFFEYF